MKVSAWDRFLIGIAPQWGLERVKARAATDAFERHYEAATTGRRTSGWSRTAGDADLTIRPALLELRMHARDLVRNNGWARRAQKVLANNTAGWGIVPKASGETPGVNAKADAIWKAWATSTQCEAEGRHTFYGIQTLAMKTITTAGEVLIRRRPRYATDGLAIPLQLQVLEPDFLDHSKSFTGDLRTGPTIQGVEFDLIGRRNAYWIFDNHPGSGRSVNPSKRVDASEILHVFDTERPAQTRGVSWFGTSIVGLKDFDDYEDAELMKQKIAACFAAFVVDIDGLGAPIGEQSTTDPLVETFEPGMITQLPPGKNVVTANPPTLTSDALPTRTLRKIAAGLCVTYEDLTGDYSQVNFSSARMARLAHWANVHDWQQNMLIPLLCNGVWAWAMDQAVIAGLIPEAPPAEWTPPPMPMLEPDKEGLAYSRLVRNGVMTYSQMIREQGGDPVAHFAEYAADQKMLDALGLVLDSDARATSAAGLEQPSETADKAPPPPPVKALPPGKRAEEEATAEEIREVEQLEIEGA